METPEGPHNRSNWISMTIWNEKSFFFTNEGSPKWSDWSTEGPALIGRRRVSGDSSSTLTRWDVGGAGVVGVGVGVGVAVSRPRRRLLCRRRRLRPASRADVGVADQSNPPPPPPPPSTNQLHAIEKSSAPIVGPFGCGEIRQFWNFWNFWNIWNIWNFQ